MGLWKWLMNFPPSRPAPDGHHPHPDHAAPATDAGVAHDADAPPRLPASGGPITQHELAAFQTLKRQAAEFAALRTSFLHRLEGGAGVEPGALTVGVTRSTVRRLSARTLTALLGKETVKHLRKEVQPSECRLLTVTDSGAAPR